MASQRLDRIKAIFAEAVEKTGAKRTDFLQQACGTDAGLRREVEAFLQAAEQAGDFLGSSAPDAQAAIASTPPRPVHEQPDTVIDRYKLLEQIGEGGFGRVFMAEQEFPVHRRVALKIIKLGMDTKQVIARFETEQQALAMMDHPNIAKILDAGSTSAGQPYFVMELVKGVPITAYCDQNHLNTRERLDLFIPVCQAVQHAHQKGIIHRDLKPNNILVAVEDGRPIPKVIDFGIAKAMEGRLTDKSLFTGSDQMIGTPAYMSPEQAELSELDVDTRSDVYSLGVLLYELLTGTTPFDSKVLRHAAYDEIRRVIREEEPQRPSARVGTLGAELATIAAQRRAKPAALIQSIRGELDWIVMKCLEKDRVRRYDAANSLAQDVERYLSDDVVVARPPSKLYRLRKLVKRNRLAVLAVVAVALSVLVALVVSTGSFLNEREAHRQADVLRNNAEMQAAKSRQVSQFLEDMLDGVGPSVAMGTDTTMLREILDKTALRVSTDLTNQPAVAAELQATIARIYNELGEYVKAEQMARHAVAIDQNQAGDDNPAVAGLLDTLAASLGEQGRYVEAERIIREALAIRQKPARTETMEIAQSLRKLGTFLMLQGKLTEAEAVYRQALAMQQKLAGAENPDAALSLEGIGSVLDDQGKSLEAEAAYRQVLAIQKKVLGDQHPDMDIPLDNLARLLVAEGKFAEGETIAREALTLQRKLLGPHHPHELRSLWILNQALQHQGKSAEAEDGAWEILMLERERPSNQTMVTAALNNLSGVLSQEGKEAQASLLRKEFNLPNPTGQSATTQSIRR